MEELSNNSKVVSLTTMSASLTFENLPDDKKEEAFLHWLETQSPQKKLDFLDRAKYLINKGVTENTGFYHYIMINSSLTQMFLNQQFIDVLNDRLTDLIGEDVVMVAFVSYLTKWVVAPYPDIHEIITPLETQQPKFANGICFKVAAKKVTDAEHLPMYFQCLSDLIDSIIETFHRLVGPHDADELFKAFSPIINAENRISFDFDILVNGQKRRFLYFFPI